MGNEVTDISVQEINDWCNAGEIILLHCDRLNPRGDANQENSKNFKVLYFNLSKAPLPDSKYKDTFKALNKRAGQLGSADKLSDTIKDFIALSQKFCKNEAAHKEFQMLIRKEGKIPVDEEEIKRRKAEEQRREEERKRREWEAAERARREREAKEARERAAREAEERARREQQAREAARKARKVRNFILTCIVLILALLYGAIKYDYIKIDYLECKEYLAKAEMCFSNGEYNDALYFYREARNLVESEKKKEKISDKIKHVRKVQTDMANELKAEIRVLLNTFSKVSFKYGKPVNDLKTTQEKINLLKKIDPNDPDLKELQSDLDYHNKRTR